MKDQKKKTISRNLNLTIASIALLFLGVVYAWSIFRSPIQKLIPSVTDGQLSMTFTISMITFCVGGLISGFLAKKISTTKRIIITAILICTGLYLMSTLTSSTSNAAIKMYLYYGVIVGTGVGIGYIAIISNVVGYFQDKVGFASGTLMLAFGFGSILLGSLAKYLTGIYGITTTFFILGVMFILPLLICAFAAQLEVHDTPEIEKKENDIINEEKNYTSLEMIKTPYFIVFALWTIAICTSSLMIIGSASQISQSFGAPAIIGLFISLTNGFSRIISGKTFDLKGRKVTMIMTNTVFIMASLLLIFGFKSNMMIMGILGLLFIGFSFGTTPALASAVIKNKFGSKYYPSNFSIINTQIIVSSVLSNIIIGALKGSDGSFYRIYIAILASAIIAIALTLILNKLEKNK